LHSRMLASKLGMRNNILQWELTRIFHRSC
jgi:hypothetical protein